MACPHNVIIDAVCKTCGSLVITSGRELDWATVEKAAKAILKEAQDSGFTPPESVDIHLVRMRRVCTAMDAIVDALKLRKGR